MEEFAYATYNHVRPFLQWVQDAIRSTIRCMMPFQDSEPEGMKAATLQEHALDSAQREVTLQDRRRVYKKVCS